MLEVKNLSVTYNGNIKALKSINLNVDKGELVVLIGANGAGKTTLLKSLTGLLYQIIISMSTDNIKYSY